MKAILILGAAVWKTGPSPALRRRAIHGALLARDNPDWPVIACGGMGHHAPTEASAIKLILQAAGIDAARIHLEHQSTTTLENIAFACPILTQSNISEVVIVTDRYHGPRAALTARSFGLTARISAPPRKGSHTTTQIKQFIREGFAYPAYAVRLWRYHRSIQNNQPKPKDNA